MSIKKYIDIIIPTKDRNDYLKDCLDSLSKSLTYDATLYYYNVIIIKGHSGKRVDHDFFALIKHPNYRNLNISYIVIKNNTSFTQSINVGLKRSLAKKHKPDYIAFLHDDSIVFKGWLEALIKPMDENVKIYGTGGITGNELDEQCFSKTYDLFNFKDEYKVVVEEIKDATYEKYSHIANRLKDLNFYEFKKDQNNGFISLFCALFRKEAFENFGFFDENLISSFRVEDEFCKRLLDNGKTVALVPQAFTKHECFTLTFKNYDIIKDKLLRDATLHNIKIKRQLNPIISNTKKQYVVYTHMKCEETPFLNNMFGFHDKSTTSFVCFTERDIVLGETWNIINIHPFLEIEEFKNNRNLFEEFIKLHPHYFFANYNASIWVDFKYVNMIPLDMKEFIRLLDETTSFLALESDKFNCSWKYLISRIKDRGLINTHKNPMLTEEGLQDTVLSTYRFYNFPQNIGFIDTSVLGMKHNDESVINVLNKIWKNFVNIAKDDKLWFNFMLWLNKKSYYSIPINVYKLKMNELIKEIEELKNTREEIHNA